MNTELECRKARAKNRVAQSEFEFIDYIHNDAYRMEYMEYIIIKKDNKYGIIDGNYDIVVECLYPSIEEAKKHFFGKRDTENVRNLIDVIDAKKSQVDQDTCKLIDYITYTPIMNNYSGRPYTDEERKHLSFEAHMFAREFMAFLKEYRKKINAEEEFCDEDIGALAVMLSFVSLTPCGSRFSISSLVDTIILLLNIEKPKSKYEKKNIMIVCAAIRRSPYFRKIFENLGYNLDDSEDNYKVEGLRHGMTNEQMEELGRLVPYISITPCDWNGRYGRIDVLTSEDEELLYYTSSTDLHPFGNLNDIEIQSLYNRLITRK